MNKIKPYERRVFYYETDKMGIMHHSNYVRIFEETRVSLMEQMGKPFAEIEADGLLAPVLSVECSYKYPLRFDEPFAVYAKLTRFTGTTFELEYRITSRLSGKLCAEGRSSHCFTDLNMKPVRTKRNFPAIYELFAEYVGAETED